MTDEELDDLSRRAHAIYDRDLRVLLEPEHNGELVAIHVDTGDYAVANTSSRARVALRNRHPLGMIVTTKIGPPSDDPLAYRILASRILSGKQK
jgi:hypothetical protein